MRRWLIAALGLALSVTPAAARDLPPDLGTVPLPTAPAPLPAVLSMDDCVAIALARSPLLQAALAELDASRARVGETAAPQHLQATAQTNWSRQEQPLGQPVSVSINGSNETFQISPQFVTISRSDLTLNQLISDGGRLRSLVASNVAEARALRWEAIHGATQLACEVRKAYVDVLTTRAQATLAEQSVADAEAHKRMAQTAYAAGMAPRADVVSAEVPLSQARLSLERNRNEVLQANARLNRYLGLALLSSTDLDGRVALKPDTWTLEEALQTARDKRGDLLARGQRVVEAQRALDVARVADNLQIGMGAGYSLIGYNQQDIPINGGWNIGLTLSQPLLNGGLSRARLAEAAGRLKAAQAQRQELGEAIELEVTQAWLAWDLARRQVAEAEAVLQQATENLGLVRGQYTAGVGSMLAVQDAEVQMTQARTHEVEIRFGITQALLSLFAAMGWAP